MPDDTPALDELADDEDELDGCDIDLAADPTPDEELLEVVFGDDPVKWEEYRAWFAAVREAEEAERDAPPDMDR